MIVLACSELIVDLISDLCSNRTLNDIPNRDDVFLQAIQDIFRLFHFDDAPEGEPFLSDTSSVIEPDDTAAEFRAIAWWIIVR